MDSRIQDIVKVLSEQSGIHFNATSGIKDGFQYIDLHPLSPEPPQGFSIRFHLFWKRLVISFVPDNFARLLISSMGQDEGGKKEFSILTSSLVDSSMKILMVINNKEVDPLHPESWDKEWMSFQLELEMISADNDFSNLQRARPIIIHSGIIFITMLMSLLPVQEIPEVSPDIEGLPEGAVVRITVNRYERSLLNRAACIAVHGVYCNVCGMSFKQIYGELGDDYIQVHHITPVSKLGHDYIIDPINDMIPVCPNCHAMLHRTNPPMSIDQLKTIIQSVQIKP